MVVDDSLTVRRVTQRLLEREGYRVVLAKDGLDALEQFGRHELARQQAVQAVIGQVVRVHREAADHVQLLVVAEAPRHPHRRIVLHHVGHAARLLIQDQRLAEPYVEAVKAAKA